MKSLGLRSMSDYKIFKDQLSEIDYPYTEIHRGTTITIECDDKKWQFKKGDDQRGIGSKGFHICRLVKENVLGNIADRQEFDYKRLNSLAAYEELFNPIGLIKTVGNDMYSIDIDDCYWHTLYKLGYIDFHLFITGLRKKNWKDGRNASLGSLAAKKRVFKFQGNKQIGDMEVVNPDERLSAVRNHVIYAVWELFKYIITNLENHFLMFFKDCVYVDTIESKTFVVEHLLSIGYKCKIRHHNLTAFNQENNYTSWYCYEDRINPNKPKTKFYQFIDDQSLRNIDLKL